MAVVGFIMLMKDWKSFRISSHFSRLIRLFISSVGVLFVIAVLSGAINANFDPFFYKFPIVLFISFSSAYCYIKLIAFIYNKEISNEVLISFFVGAVLLQCFLSALIFVLPPFRAIIFGLVPMTEMNEFAVTNNIHPTEDVLFRMIPVGYDFWGNGTCFAIVIFFIALLINHERNRNTFVILLLLLVPIVVVGASISRTSLIGLPFFILYLMLSKGDRKNKKFLFNFSLILIPITVFAYSLFLESNPMFEGIFERAFSLFYIFKDTGEMQSVESMVGQAVIPTDLKTWIIGDGLMSDPLNPGTGFYKGVDIGVWRLIWGVGLFGLLMFSILQYLYIKLAGFYKLEAAILFIIYCAFMYKGIFYYDLIMSPFIALALFSVKNRRKSLHGSESSIVKDDCNS